MPRYRIYYDGFGKPFCQIDTETGKVYDPHGISMRRFPDYVYAQWEAGGGRIVAQDTLLGHSRRSSPPEGMDEFEYIDWQMTH